MKVCCLEAMLFHYSKLQRITSFTAVVGICTYIIDMVFEGIFFYFSFRNYFAYLVWLMTLFCSLFVRKGTKDEFKENVLF
jgi:hypothetical protein